MTPEAIFFDAGLTLLRAAPSLGGVYARVAARHGAAVDPAAFETAAEAAFHEMGREHRASDLRTSDAAERESWIRHARRVYDGVGGLGGAGFEGWFEDLYREFGSHHAWEPFDDTVPCLTALKERGVRMAVVSNWDSRLRGILEARGLTPFFETVVISAEVGWRKPSPEIFRVALSRMGLAPSAVVHVGDSVGDDVEGAAAAGIRGVLLDREGRRGTGVGVVRGLGEVGGYADRAVMPR
jgi:putative hydrolase of the HAD superfamily